MTTQDLKFRVLSQVVGQGAIESFRKQISGLGKDASSVRGSVNSLTSGLKLLAGSLVAREAINFGRSIVNVADELDELSEKTGIAVKELASLKGAADIEGIAVDNLAKALQKLSVNTVEAANGNQSFIATFKAAGVAVRDANGNIRNAGDITRDLADRFASLKDGPEKAALAVRLFGKAGAELIPLLNKGSAEIDKFSVAISDDFAARAGQFNDTISLIGIQLKNGLTPGIEAILPALQDVLNVFTTAPESGEDVVSIFEAIGEAVRVTAAVVNVFVEAFSQGLDTVITLARVAGSAVISAFEQIGDSIVTRARQFKEVTTLNFEEAGKLEDAFNQRSAQRGKEAAAERERLINNLADRTEKRVTRTFDITNRLAKNSFLFGDGTADEIRARQRAETAPTVTQKRTGGIDSSGFGSTSAERNRVQEFIDQQRLETEQRRQALGDINLTRSELAKLTEARKIEAEAIRQGKTLNEEQRAELQKATQEIIAQREALIELEREQSRSFGAGAKEFLRDYADEAANTAAQVKQVFSTAFRGLEDALTDFVTTGKLDFRSFANAVIEDLIRISIRRAILGPIAGSIGAAFSGSAAIGAFADGGIMTSRGAVPLKKYASGGVANSPQLALFGEGSLPEAYVPLPDGRRIPVNVKNEGQGPGGGDVNVTVVVNTENGSQQTQGDTGNARQLATIVANLVKGELVTQKRPGGLLAT